MAQDPLNDRVVVDEGDQPEPAAAARTGQDVISEAALH
jgi:hypothetical protein